MARVTYFRRVKAGPHVAGIATPVNTVLPVITGDTAGEDCSTSNGTWTNSSDFTYQWYLDGVLLAGETTNTITTDAGWAGQTLSVIVYGGNGAGKIAANAAGVVLQAAASYTGPLDIVPGAVAAYGQRALSAAMLGSAIYTLRRDSDDTTQSFSSDATTGVAPIASITAFLGLGNGFVSTWNDQSGNSKDGLQATSISQPQWSNAQYGLISAFTFSEQYVATSGTVSFPSGAYTVFAVQNTNTGGPTVASNWEEASGPEYMILNSYAENPGPTVTATIAVDATSDAQVLTEAGGEAEDLVVSTANLLIDAAWTFGFTNIRVNGVTQPISLNSDIGPVGPFAHELCVGVDDAVSPTDFFSGNIAEVIVYASVLTDPQRLAIRQNIAAYYGITLS